MYELISSLMNYILTIIIYLFIFGVIRLIYLDIKSMNARKAGVKENSPYLKLINQRELLDFKVEETYILDDSAVVGRSDKSDMIIKDPFISGAHARFLPKDGRYMLEDLGSTNGTYINGDKIDNTGVTLANGDKIKIGQVEFLYVGNTNEVKG